MDDLSKETTETLIKWKEEIGKNLEYEANNFFWNMVYMKDIYLNKNGELETVWNMGIIKLKDLVDKDTGEKIFKKEFQTHSYRLSDRNLKYMKVMWEAYKKMEERYTDISHELLTRKYGDEIINPDATEHELHKFTLTYRIEILEENLCTPEIFIPKQKTFIIDYNTCKMKIDDSSNQASYSKSQLFPIVPQLPNLKPIKTYMNVNLLENLSNPEKRKYYYVEKEAEQNNWQFRMDKYSRDNFVDYYLYNRKEYNDYMISLKRALLELCKQWNDKEFEKIENEIKEIESKMIKFSSTEDLKIIHGHLGKAYLQFENWYKFNQTQKMKIKHGDLKRITIEIYQQLLNMGELNKDTRETKNLPKKNQYNFSEPALKEAHPITSKIIPLLSDKYELTSSNIRSINDYIRQGYYQIKKSNGSYVVRLVENKKG